MANTYIDLFWGYTAIWGILVFFLIRLTWEQKSLLKRLTEVEERLGVLNAKGSGRAR